MTFTELSAGERVAVVERYMVELPPDPEAPGLSKRTRDAIRRAQHVFADDDLDDDQRQGKLDRWRGYIDTLGAAEADEALCRLKLFWQLYAGRSPPRWPRT